MSTLRPPLLVALSFSVLTSLAVSTGVQAEPPASVAQGMRIDVTDAPPGRQVFDGENLVAGYQSDSNGTPILFPVIGPAGHRMTRDYPMLTAGESERDDHPHHRSLWFTHGEVNEIDFWATGPKCGRIVQREIQSSNTAGKAILRTENDWVSPDGDPVLSDVRQFTFWNNDGRRIIDCDFLLQATHGDVNFGDTKEGSFGIRVAGSMKVDAKLGGIITNAEGDTNGDAWGTKSAWVDYSGPVNDETVGITIHDHPSSFAYPCRWHVRTYGLFAANPFGVHHFTKGDKTSGIVLKQGDQMRLNYRVVLRSGPLDSEVAESDSKQFANDPRPNLP